MFVLGRLAVGRWAFLCIIRRGSLALRISTFGSVPRSVGAEEPRLSTFAFRRQPSPELSPHPAPYNGGAVHSPLRCHAVTKSHEGRNMCKNNGLQKWAL